MYLPEQGCTDMDEIIQRHIDDLFSDDRARQSQGFMALMAAAAQPVDWAYDLWDALLADLTHRDNHRRAHAAQLLPNLAKSDPQQRIVNDFPALLNVTRDERLVTARHCLQALWCVGVAGKAQQQVYMDGLERRYHDCVDEKNSTLIRYDILQSMRNAYDAVQDDSIRQKALALIELEADPKYRKKYAAVWKIK